MDSYCVATSAGRSHMTDVQPSAARQQVYQSPPQPARSRRRSHPFRGRSHSFGCFTVKSLTSSMVTNGKSSLGRRLHSQSLINQWRQRTPHGIVTFGGGGHKRGGAFVSARGGRRGDPWCLQFTIDYYMSLREASDLTEGCSHPCVRRERERRSVRQLPQQMIPFGPAENAISRIGSRK